MKTALSIAGSDSIGGAGIQADIKTITCHDVYAMTAITALTAQNTLGVQAIYEVSPLFLEQQLDAIFQDIFPDAVKIGMLSSKDLISVISRKLKEYQARNIVLDPVMVSTSGSRLLAEDAITSLQEELFPLASIITPNIPEAEILASQDIHSEEDMKAAAQKIGEKFHCAVLCKGGHQVNTANDILYLEGEFYYFRGERIENSNTHGTGCTLSSAIASHLAKGEDLIVAIQKSKGYISRALKANLNLGKGPGPLKHNV